MRKSRLTIVMILCVSLVISASAFGGQALDRILKRGELIVGTSGNQPPLNATTKDGKIIGLEVDLSRSIAAAMGVKLKIASMSFSELLPALSEGKVDMILSGMTITPKRNLNVVFVGPYYVTGKAFLTKTETIAALENADGINDPKYSLAALKGSTSQLYVERVLPEAKLVLTESYDEALEMIIQDKVDAMVADYHYCAVSVFRYKEKGLTTVKAPFTYEPIGIALPPDDLQLLNWTENFLLTITGSGDLSKLGERWFKGGAWLNELQ